jgi:hypothetical protein
VSSVLRGDDPFNELDMVDDDDAVNPGAQTESTKREPVGV